nr:hypothetical protein [Amycolatopsis sp. GM8]
MVEVYLTAAASAGLANGESDDGRFDEFRLFWPARRVKSTTWPRNVAIIARSSAFSAASSS